MNMRTILALIVALAPSLAHAAPKKPSVCSDFRVFQNDAKQVMGACYDGDKPALWSSWTIVEVTEPSTGAKRRYAVGFK